MVILSYFTFPATRHNLMDCVRFLIKNAIYVRNSFISYEL